MRAKSIDDISFILRRVNRQLTFPAHQNLSGVRAVELQAGNGCDGGIEGVRMKSEALIP